MDFLSSITNQERSIHIADNSPDNGQMEMLLGAALYMPDDKNDMYSVNTEK